MGMKLMKKSEIIFVVFLISFFSIAFSNDAFADAPVLSGSVPEHDSYIGGGDVTFYVNVSGADLNTGTVKMFIKSEDAPGWDEYPMGCVLLEDVDWRCSNVISFDIVGSDTIELFYFTAADNLGVAGELGNSSASINFTADLNPPVISFESQSSKDYVSDMETILIFVTDATSGVNSTSVEISFDSETWEQMTDYEDGVTFYSEIDTTTYDNNESISIYVRCADMIGNDFSDSIIIYVDNEIPTIEIIEPENGENVIGIIHLEINSTDVYSGVSSATFSIGDSTNNSMDCVKGDNNYVCDEYFDTSEVSDGMQTVTITVTDDAGNSNADSLQIDIDNTAPYVSITSPEGNSHARAAFNVTAVVSNNISAVSGVSLRIAGSVYDETTNMICDDSRDCYFGLSTSSLSDGAYTLTATANFVSLPDLTHSIDLIIDNTIPDFTIDQPPETVVDAIIYPKVIIIDDYGVDSSSVRYNISTFSKTMLCAKFISGKKYVCSDNFDTTRLIDNYYDIIFYAEDLAGNSGTATKRILTDNTADEGPSPDEVTTTTTGAEDSTTTTTITTTTTTIQGQTTTTQSSETSGEKSLPIKVIEKITTPVLVLFGNVQKSFETSDSGTLKAFGTSMIIFLLVIAVMKTSGVKNLLFGKKGEDE